MRISKNSNQKDVFTLNPRYIGPGWGGELSGLVLDQDGNVGIGETSPKARLHVKGKWYKDIMEVQTAQGKAVLEVKNDGKVQVGFGTFDNTNDRAELYLGSLNNSITGIRNKGISLSTHGSAAKDALFIESGTGKVNIGGRYTGGTHSNYKLSVKGKVIAQEFYVTNDPWSNTPWPDYVFADAYQLRPLESLRRFIAENEHLPDVPSACEVEKEGFGLGQMDAVLLRKIEELTLYLLEINEAMLDIRKENVKLRKQINKLK